MVSFECGLDWSANNLLEEFLPSNQFNNATFCYLQLGRLWCVFTAKRLTAINLYCAIPHTDKFKSHTVVPTRPKNGFGIALLDPIFLKWHTLTIASCIHLIILSSENRELFWWYKNCYPGVFLLKSYVCKMSSFYRRGINLY